MYASDFPVQKRKERTNKHRAESTATTMPQGSDEEAGVRGTVNLSERTHRRKRRRDLELIPRLPCWLHEGRRDVGRYAGHVLTPTRHRERTERVGE